MRTCVGCRRTAPTDELVRVARGPNGSLVVGRHLPGRGAWLCQGSAACVDRAITRRAFDRAFRARLEDRQLDRDRLVTCLLAGSGEGGSSEGRAR